MAKLNTLPNLKWLECTYCGQCASCLDHVIPWQFGKARKRKKSEINRKDCVPCCSECNALLGGNLYISGIAGKADYIAERLSVRYAGLLNTPYWDEEEFEELEGTLRQTVIAKQNQRLVVLNRIRWASTVARYCGLTIEEVWKGAEKGIPLVG